jgi:hypothetical protein
MKITRIAQPMPSRQEALDNLGTLSNILSRQVQEAVHLAYDGVVTKKQFWRIRKNATASWLRIEEALRAIERSIPG